MLTFTRSAPYSALLLSCNGKSCDLCVSEQTACCLCCCATITTLVHVYMHGQCTCTNQQTEFCSYISKSPKLLLPVKNNFVYDIMCCTDIWFVASDQIKLSCMYEEGSTALQRCKAAIQLAEKHQDIHLLALAHAAVADLVPGAESVSILLLPPLLCNAAKCGSCTPIFCSHHIHIACHVASESTENV